MRKSLDFDMKQIKTFFSILGLFILMMLFTPILFLQSFFSSFSEVLEEWKDTFVDMKHIWINSSANDQ